jgi:cobyrinic acid a,c-diamide synthase
VTRALIIAAPRSGSGKTTVTLGLLTALARRGWRMAAAKAGPDYIDPAFHAAATGRSGVNLDSWAMPPALIADLLTRASAGADLLLIEGAMGLFDGVLGTPGRSGAAADLAARFRLPVLLVLDVSGQSQSAAAIARGFATHDPAVRVAGVLLNRVGSERHTRLVTEAMAPLGLPVVGSLPRDASLTLPERHLGLVQASEQSDLPDRMTQVADALERHTDLGAIASLAEIPLATANEPAALLMPPGQRIALAQDAAFTFMYGHVLDGWRRAGAEIVPFSPLRNEPPPESCDCCWLPGGYPELHANRIAGAARFRDGLVRFAASRPVHGECGGYMVLGRSLETADGVTHPMTGLLGHATSFARRRLHLGYREARLLASCPAGTAGTVLRGHEFHYASLLDAGLFDASLVDASLVDASLLDTCLVDGDDLPLADMADANGATLGYGGTRRGFASGTFFHVIAPAPSQP